MLSAPVRLERHLRGPFDNLRAREFSRLDSSGTAYLDYTGAALYPESLVRRDAHRLLAGGFGNPHAEHAASRQSTAAMDRARALTLQFFDAAASDYEVVFTANASAAIRILAESFPFGRGSRLVMTADNHNSVNGLCVAAARRRAAVAQVPLDGSLRAVDPEPWLDAVHRPSLFAFPAQSNFSGVRHPLGWVAEAQRRGYRVLLDAAAFAAGAPLSLSRIPADYVSISYYKLFGYPTGVGALIVRRDALTSLRRSYFAGGTVQFVSIQNRLARLRDDGGRFEDGTPNFLAMPAVSDGLEWLQSLGMPAVERRIAAASASLLARLAALGDRVEIYGPLDARARGGTIAFNLRRGGRLLAYEEVEAAARGADIAIRGGCFCNPGAAERAFRFRAGRVRDCLRGRFSIARFRSCLDGAAVGALRASVGIPTTEGDLDRLCDCIVDLTSSPG